MKIFTTKEINEIFRYTVEHDGVTINELIDRVGKGVCERACEDAVAGRRIVVFAGWGINGAYALATSKHLMRQGFVPEIYLFNIGGSRLCPEAVYAKKLLKKEFPACKLYEIERSFEIPELDPGITVIDGLFGADLDRPLPKSLGMLVRSINESGAYILSIEIPSGLFGEWNAGNSVSRDIIHARQTVAIEFPSLSFFMNENIPLVGDWSVINIGLNAEAIRRAPFVFYLVTSHEIHHILKPRRANTSKADYGSALICAGSYGMMGAAVLAARGCLRAGVGKVTSYGPKCGYQILQTAAPCAMFKCDSNDSCISKIIPDGKYKAIAVGPGIGTADATVTAVENFLKMCHAKQQPLIIDADALNCIAARPIMLNYLPVLSVLSPHAGEFDRIFGAQPSAEARLQKALEVSAYHNIIIILKGRYSMIVRPDGKVYINSSGSPALATPGSGDVLTGVITALVAQDYTSETASLVAAYVHGLAGEMAEAEHGSYGVTAEDIADNIGRAINKIMNLPK